MDLVEINDKRKQQEFKNTTFSGFNKSAVRKELLNNLINSKIEQSNYWGAELICAGQFNEIWETILLFYSYHIHLGNPKLAIYLSMKIQKFKDIISNGYLDSEIKLRNNPKIRKLFCEIICILCYSKRKHCFEEIKIKPHEFDLTQLTDMLKAPDVNYAQEIFLEDDPKGLFIAINELTFHLSKDSRNSVNACYWIEWIIQFEQICKVKKEHLKCNYRENMPIDVCFKKDIIWIIWSALLNEADKQNALIKRIILSLLQIFTLKYNSNCSRKRKYILYFAVELLVENVNLDEGIVREADKEELILITGKIDNIYKQIKENEYSPGTDYLFLHEKTSNLDKTIKRLETMNTFSESFIPRTS